MAEFEQQKQGRDINFGTSPTKNGNLTNKNGVRPLNMGEFSMNMGIWWDIGIFEQ